MFYVSVHIHSDCNELLKSKLKLHLQNRTIYYLIYYLYVAASYFKFIVYKGLYGKTDNPLS